MKKWDRDFNGVGVSKLEEPLESYSVVNKGIIIYKVNKHLMRYTKGVALSPIEWIHQNRPSCLAISFGGDATVA